jgi:beta-barrel assembly-enhancing protease
MTDQTFQATLHDRKIGVARAVRVRATPGVLFIGSEYGPALEWVLSDITSARLHDDGSVILQNDRLFLEVKQPGFREALEHAFPKNKLFRRAFFDRVGIAGCLAGLLIFFVPLFIAYKWGAPWIAERAAQKIPPETEQQLGDQLYRGMIAQYEVDTAKTRAAQRFYEALGYGGAYNIKITVVKSPVVNAFALPGGNIVVFDSIISLTQAPEQLAGLLAHEASHVHLKHSLRTLFRQWGGNFVLSLLLGDYGGLSSVILQQGDALAGLSYSRALELEADRNGLKLMRQSGIPQRGIPDLFRLMQKTIEPAEETGKMPAFLYTHPSMPERIRVAEELIGRENISGAVREDLQELWEVLKSQNR